MTYEELMNTIEKSTQSDWLHSDERGVWTYKKDLMIHIEEERDEEEDPKNRRFGESWVEHFPDPVAYRADHTIYYGSSFVETVAAVSVDGHRTIIPLPKSAKDLVITPWQYRFGKIIEIDPHGPHSLDAKMEYAGIRVE